MTTNTLVPPGVTWRYRDNGSDQGTAWRAPAFDDSSWSVGAAQLGYGDGDEITVVSDGGNPNSRYITTYFRHSFDVTNASIYSQLTVRLLRDDGAVVYLNGNEVFRSNMPGGAITHGTLASTGVGGGSESTFFTALVDATHLVTGANLLAVEVHQAAPDSSDISFDLQLLGTINATGPILLRGPYLQTGTTNSVIVRWRTDLAGESVVRYGTNPADLDQTVADATATTEHILTVTNLAPGTKYFYAIAAGTTTIANGTNHFFVTAPPIGLPKPVRLWVLGDSGTANANARAVRDAYLSFATTNTPADLWLMLGDNAYNSGLDAEYQSAVFDLYPTVLCNTVLWSTIGNHDTAQQTSIASFPYLDIFSLPQNAEAGGLASGTERYYSFDFANVHFVCLDAMTSSRAPNGAMATWLGDDLSATAQDWIIAFWHHPPYTKGSHNSDAESELIQMRENILPILESHGVDLVLCGHSHAYERSLLLNGHYGSSWTLTSAMKLDDGDGREDGGGSYVKTPSGLGANYVVAGHGGQISGGPLDHPAMFFSLNELGSLVIDISTNRLDLRMLGTTSVRDHYTVIKQGPPAPSFDRFARQGFKARQAEFLTNGYGAVASVTSPSPAGAGVSRAGDWVFYVPPAGFTNSDAFGFTATDNYGGNVPATSMVNIAVDNAPSQNMTVDNLGDGSVRLRFSGIPGRSYLIQYSNGVNNPAWTTLATSTADLSGVFEFVDTPPAGFPRFYRSIQP